MADEWTPQPVRSSKKVDFKRKLVVVGDGGCGKTSLMLVYVENKFPEGYVPTVFENYVAKVNFNEKYGELALWDTAGQEDYDRLRPLSYPESDVILICFAVDYTISYDNVRDKWFPEISHFCDGVPIILVATKTDLRSDANARSLLAAQGKTCVTMEAGQDLAKEIGAKYAECSAREGEGVKEVFELALKLAMKRKYIKLSRKLCTVL